MSLGKKIATGIMRGAAGRMWGFPPVLMREIVERLGAAGALKWFAKNLPKYENTLKEWGPIRTHLICVEASLLNACSHCAYAHGYAFQLFYFQQHGKLFPLDEHEVVRLRDGTDDELKSALVQALTEADLPDEVAALDRLWRIKFDGAPTTTDEEKRMAHLLGMFDILNYCAIDSRVPIDSAHDPINKDEALKLRYAEARLNAKRAT